MSRIGLVTGARAEARCLGDLPLAVLCSGANAERAALAAELHFDEGAGALVSFGLAGALSPDLETGTILLPQTVLAPNGMRYPVDGVWRKALWLRLEAAGIECRGGLLVGSDDLVGLPTAKQRLFESTAAVAVDMESHAVALAARELGVPFVVLRAVADRVDEEVPRAALAALGPDGRVRVLALLAALARRPRDLPLLLRLARTSRPALQSLATAVAAAGPELALPASVMGRGGPGSGLP